MEPHEALPALRELGFGAEDAQVLADHFLDAERRGRAGHGLARIAWLATLEFDPAARPVRLEASDGFELWDGNGALGYLTLAAICDAVRADPPEHARVVVARHCFPTGMLGYWVRGLAEAGLVAILTATSPPVLPHPDDPEGPKLVPTIPLTIGVPSSDGKPLVSDVSTAKATQGDVLVGRASPQDLVPFGGEDAHKAFALAAGLMTAAQALAGDDRGAVLVVARPVGDPVPALRAAAAGRRLPGDR